MEQVGGEGKGSPEPPHLGIQVPPKPHLKLGQLWSILAASVVKLIPESRRLAPHASAELVARFDVSRWTIRNILNDYFSQIDQDIIYPDLSGKQISRKGQNSQLDEELATCLMEFNSMAGYRLTISEFTRQFNQVYGTELSVATCQRYMNSLSYSLKSVYIKPKLTLVQIVRRLDFILEKITPLPGGGYAFEDCKNIVHSDEKYFWTKRERYRIRVRLGEEKHPTPSTRHKSHIPKMMFLAVVCVPQLRPDGSRFEGKVCMVPIIQRTPALRSSKNRPAGAEVIECMSLTSDEYLHLFETRIVPAIKIHMAWLKGEQIIVQHDGARPHTGKDNQFLLECVGHADGWNISFRTQPAQSPDLNVLDLTLFHAMQRASDQLRDTNDESLQHLEDSVTLMWQQFDWQTIERGFGVLHEIYRQVLNSGGTNTYKLPHSDVRKRQSDEVEVIDRSVSNQTRLAGEDARDLLVNEAASEDEEESDEEDA